MMKKNCFKSYVTFRQRIVGGFMALFMLLQICLPSVALAADRFNDTQKIQSLLNSPLFVKQTDNANEIYSSAIYTHKDQHNIH
jgi:hypothetical protein